MSTKIRWLRVDLLFLSIIVVCVLSASDLVSAQTEQVIDENGAPLFRVDPFGQDSYQTDGACSRSRVSM